MKICDIVQSFTARSGGIRTYIRAKQDYLRDRSGVSHVLIKPGAVDRLRLRGNLRVYEVAAPFVPGYRPYRFNVRLHKVAEILRHEQPDLIELASPYLDPWPVFAHRRRHGGAVVGYYHADFPAAYVEAPVASVLGPAVGRAVGRCAERYARAVYGRCDLTVTASMQCERRLAQFGVPRVARIPLGVDTRVFRPSRRDAHLWPDLLGPGGGPVLVYCGHLDREKQVEVLVAAHEQLPAKLGARLVLIGDGPLKPQLTAAARANRRLAVVPYQRQRGKLAALLASADVYVTAGPFETFGLSVLEAQACGLPVVGVAAGALIDRVPPHLGRLGPVGDAGAMAANIVELLRGDYRGMGQAASRDVAAYGSWRTVFDRLSAIYQTMVGPVKRHQALIALLLAAFIANLVYTVIATDRSAFEAAVRIRPPMLGLAAALALLPWLCNALRVYLWLRLIRPDLGDAAPASLRAVLAAEVGAAMTPTAVGGAPVKAGMLVRSGLTVAEAVTVTAAGGLEDIVVIAVGLPLAMMATGLGAGVVGRLQGFRIRVPEPGVLAVVVGLFVLVGVVALVSRRRSRVRSGRTILVDWWRETASVIGFLRQRGVRVFVRNLALAAVHWAARLSIITALLAGLGIAVQPLPLAVLQWVCFAIMSVTPTPGAVGGAEASFLYIFAEHVPAAAVPVALAAWRFVTFYAVTGIAALLLALPIWGSRSAASFTRPARATR